MDYYNYTDYDSDYYLNGSLYDERGVFVVDDPNAFRYPWLTSPEFYPNILTYVTTLFIGVTGNVAVIIVMRTDRTSRTNTNLFLCSLAVADLMMLIVCVPLEILKMFAMAVNFGQFNCSVREYIETVSFSASAFNLTLVSLERFFVIVFPLRSKSFCTKKKCKMALALFWLLALLSGLPVFYVMDGNLAVYSNKEGTITVTTQICHYHHTKVYAVAKLMLFFIIPFLVMLVCYTVVIRQLWMSTKNFKGVATPGHGWQKREKSHSCNGDIHRLTNTIQHTSNRCPIFTPIAAHPLCSAQSLDRLTRESKNYASENPTQISVDDYLNDRLKVKTSPFCVEYPDSLYKIGTQTPPDMISLSGISVKKLKSTHLDNFSLDPSSRTPVPMRQLMGQDETTFSTNGSLKCMNDVHGSIKHKNNNTNLLSQSNSGRHLDRFKASYSSKRCTNNPHRDEKMKKKLKKEGVVYTRKQVIKMLVVVVLLFAICWFPNIVVEMLIATDSQSFNTAFLLFKYITTLLPFVHCCMNPIIYCCMSRNFKKSMWKLVARRCPCCQDIAETRLSDGRTGCCKCVRYGDGCCSGGNSKNVAGCSKICCDKQSSVVLPTQSSIKEKEVSKESESSVKIPKEIPTPKEEKFDGCLYGCCIKDLQRDNSYRGANKDTVPRKMSRTATIKYSSSTHCFEAPTTELGTYEMETLSH